MSISSMLNTYQKPVNIKSEMSKIIAQKKAKQNNNKNYVSPVIKAVLDRKPIITPVSKISNKNYTNSSSKTSTYKKIDNALFGILPGGTTPKEWNINRLKKKKNYTENRNDLIIDIAQDNADTEVQKENIKNFEDINTYKFYEYFQKNERTADQLRNDFAYEQFLANQATQQNDFQSNLTPFQSDFVTDGVNASNTKSFLQSSGVLIALAVGAFFIFKK